MGATALCNPCEMINISNKDERILYVPRAKTLLEF